jgi:hypothetical protein
MFQKVTEADKMFVKHATWDAYTRRVERANLKKYGESLSAAGISRRASHLILEIQDDRGGMIVCGDWRKAMRGDD